MSYAGQIIGYAANVINECITQVSIVASIFISRYIKKKGQEQCLQVK